jgi:recombination protein RecA
MSKTAIKKGTSPKKAVLSDDQKLNAEIAELGLASVLGLVDEFPSAHAHFTPTLIPSLDILLHKDPLGLVHERHVEIYSKDGSACKTTVSLQILAGWQKQGLKTALVDVEGTMTEDYLNLLGVITRVADCPTGVYPVRMVSHRKDKNGKAILLTLEEVFDTISKIGDTFDLIVVDSVDALMERSESEKTAEENAKQGGIAKRMSEFMRKTVSRKATILWINQTRQSMAYNPTGNTTYVTSGGRALRFYSSIRIELAVIKRLAEGDGDPWGFVVQATTIKNKLGPQWRTCNLTYIFGEGISQDFDYFSIAVDTGIIKKKGAWMWIGDEENPDLKAQGRLKMYQALKATSEVFAKVKSLIDGESVVSITDADPTLIAETQRLEEMDAATA